MDNWSPEHLFGNFRAHANNEGIPRGFSVLSYFDISKSPGSSGSVPSHTAQNAILSSPAQDRDDIHHDGEGHNHEKTGLSSISVPSIADWTSFLPRTKHVEFLKSRNWSVTSLCPMQSWPSALRLMTLKMLADPRAANLY